MAKRKIKINDRVVFTKTTDLTLAARDPRIDRVAAFSGLPRYSATKVEPGREGTVIFLDNNIYPGSVVVYIKLDKTDEIIKEYDRFHYKRI